MLRVGNAVIVTAASLLIFANSIVGQSISETTSIYRLAAGTRIPVRLDVELSSRNATRNDTFISRTVSPIYIDDSVALPEGTVIEGEVLDVRRASFGGRNGMIELSFSVIRFGNDLERRMSSARIRRFGDNDSVLISTAAIGGGAVGGLAIGSANNDGRGRWLVAGVGAAIGAGFSILRKGRDASIRPDQHIFVVLERDVVLPVTDN